MKHSFRQKINILRSILKEYALYFKYFDDCTCYFPKLEMCLFRDKELLIKNIDWETKNKYKPFIYDDLIFCIYFVNKYNNAYSFLKRFIPVKDIDKVVLRYRSKLYNEKKKEQKRQEQNKIILFDFMYKLKMIG